MINEGADIIFTASGGGNVGSLEAIKEANVKAIGVDMPSSYLAPGYVLTSALKNVGEGLKLTIKDLI
jgi:basic membrane protein A